MKVDALKALWKKYKYALCILMIGILLLVFPGNQSHEAASDPVDPSVSIPTNEEAEARLAETLREIRGVGAVRVLLAIEATEEHVYVKNEGETVFVNTGSGKQEALERKIVYPVYQGAVIVCEGAADAGVQMQVVEAVSQYTGLRSDQISVLPMKQNG